jgi:hypothetical protein
MTPQPVEPQPYNSVPRCPELREGMSSCGRTICSFCKPDMRPIWSVWVQIQRSGWKPQIQNVSEWDAKCEFIQWEIKGATNDRHTPRPFYIRLMCGRDVKLEIVWR